MRVRMIAFLLLSLVLTACNLGTKAVPTVLPTITPNNNAPSTERPVVQILSPQNGTEVVVGETVFVNAAITNARGVTSVQMFVNGNVAKVLPFADDADADSRNALLDFTPASEGNIELRVVAYKGDILSEPATLQLVVRSSIAAVTATSAPQSNVPQIDPNDPTCRALINTGLNFRTGPSTDYDIITVLSTGTLAPIIGRLGDNSWWMLRVNTREGWVSAQYTTVYGVCNAVPIVTPPPSPTPQNQPTATPTTSPTATFTVAPANTATFTPTATPGQPDLVIANITGDTSVIIPSGSSDVTTSYSIVVTNTGSGASGAFVVVHELNNVEIDSPAVSNLSPGESITLTVDITFDAAGTYTLVSRADPDNTVSEVSEVNNTGTINVSVTAE